MASISYQNKKSLSTPLGVDNCFSPSKRAGSNPLDIDEHLTGSIPWAVEKCSPEVNDTKQRIIDYYEQCDSSYQHWGEEEIYNIHHGFWDKRVQSHVQSLKNMNLVLAEQVGVKSRDRILDAGCGVGASSIWLAKTYDVNVVGINISKKAIEKAQSFAKKYGVSDKVKFCLMDYLNTDFKENSFDVVWAIESVCHALNKRDFIKEAYRILKKDGRLIIADGFLKKHYLNKMDKYFYNEWIKGWAVPNLAKIDDFQQHLKQAGFKNIKFTNATKNILPSSRWIFKRGVLGYPIYKLKRKTQIQINHAKGCIFQHFALKRKTWTYGIFYAEK